MFKYSFATLLVLLNLAPPVFAHDAEVKDFNARFIAATPPRDVVDILFKDTTGADHHLRDFAGHPVVLNLWASWCTPCVKEMPSLDQLQAELAPQGGVVIALAEDIQGSVTVPAFYRRHNLKNLKVYLDTSGNALPQLHVRSMPTTLILDAKGQEMGRIEGEVTWKAAEVLAVLKQAPKPAHHP